MTMRVLSGIQPSGNLHIGNYLGAVKNWQTMQASATCFFMLADLHSITVPQDPAQLHANTEEMAAVLLAAGISPERSTIFAQSHVPAHAELGWLLGTLTPLGWLNRMTQFKEKSGKNKEEAGLGLYAYPTLMAADILLYKPSHVPVGDDQKQHLELTRDIAGAFNRRFGVNYFSLPEPLIVGAATRVMSLRDGTKKMSKSDESDYARLNLRDDADTIAAKIKKAKTDALALPDTVEGLANRPEAENLLTIYAGLRGESLAAVVTSMAGKNFADFKKILTDLCVEVMTPIGKKIGEYLTDKAMLGQILHTGAQQAETVANKHLDEIKQIFGFLKR